MSLCKIITSVCGSRASNSVAAPSAAPTRDSPPLPTPLPKPKSPACRTTACVLVVAEPALSQDGAHSAVESRTCGCNLWLRRTRRAVPLAPSVPPCGIAHASPGSTPTSPRFPKPNSPLEIFVFGAGLHPTCLDGLPSGYILHGAIAGRLNPGVYSFAIVASGAPRSSSQERQESPCKPANNCFLLSLALS